MATTNVVAKIVAKKGCAESVKSELQKLIAPTRQEQGCIEYLLFQDNEDPDIFMFYGNYSAPEFTRWSKCVIGVIPAA